MTTNPDPGARRAAATTAERQLETLRAIAARVCARPELPADVRELFAHLVGVAGELHLQVDWLRRDLTSLAIAAPAPPRSAH